MSLCIIISDSDPFHLLLGRLFSDHPDLKEGFTLKQIINLPSLSLSEMETLTRMFGGTYSTVLTPTINFQYKNRKWEVEERNIEIGLIHLSSQEVLDDGDLDPDQKGTGRV